MPAAPKELEAFFNHALEPKPEKRFQSARIMARAFAIAASAGGLRVADELSSSGDSLSLPASPAEPLNLSLGDDEWSDVADEEPRTERIPASGDSQPAMYDLLGPDSEEFGREATVLMNEEDHREADNDDDAVPTPRQSSPRVAARPGVYAAVRAGVYNAGDAGAFNALIHHPQAFESAMAAAGTAIAEPPLRQMLASLPPTSTRSSRRRAAVIALSVAVIGAVAFALLRLGMG